MIKGKNYDIAGSNIENLGSDLERSVKETAAACEAEWAKTDGVEEGLLIWRIEKFQVVEWPKEEHGKFYDGDSYIVLNVYKNNDKVCYDLHFWLGLDTTQDEAGTAAYKTVELDTYLKDAAVQHREVMGHESDLFLSYFGGQLSLLSGGVESGFRHVEKEEFKPRLLHIKGKRKNVRAMQVPLECASLNSGDVFILDAGETLYQWMPSRAGIFEKQKAAELARALDDERGNVNIEVLDQDGCDAFWELLGGKGDVGEPTSDTEVAAPQKRLMRLSDDSGFSEVAAGADVGSDKLDSGDVFVLDAGTEIFVWIGKGSSRAERGQGMQCAMDYMSSAGRPVYLPISRVLEGGENESFNQAIAA